MALSLGSSRKSSRVGAAIWPPQLQICCQQALVVWHQRWMTSFWDVVAPSVVSLSR